MRGGSRRGVKLRVKRLKLLVKNKTFSKEFGTNLTWEEALIECHRCMWKKWELIKKKAPNLSIGDKGLAMSSKETFDGLKPLMEKLSLKKDYAKK